LLRVPPGLSISFTLSILASKAVMNKLPFHALTGLILIADRNDLSVDKVFLCVSCCYIPRNFTRIKIICCLGNYVRVSVLVMTRKRVLMRKMIRGEAAIIWAAYLHIVLRLRISGAILQLSHILQCLTRGHINIFSYAHFKAYALS
jgi:hypothetical protein